jgi:hypothetical protein
VVARLEVAFMTPHLSADVGVWIAALLTLFIFSFLYKDNPFYKFAEHLFVGVSAGYWMILNFWTVIVPNLWNPLVSAVTKGTGPSGHAGMMTVELGDYRLLLVIPGILGVLLFTRLFGRIGWLSRWSLAVIIGVYAGLKTTGFAQGDFVQQLASSFVSFRGTFLETFNAFVLTVGLLASLLFFFFSREHKGALGVASRLGVWFLMIGFGAGYGFTVMSRISLLIGRFQFLIGDWLGLR